MKNFTYVLDIGTGSIKLLTGYILEGRPLIVDVQMTRFPLLSREGKMSDPTKVAQEIKKLIKKTEEILNVKIDQLIVNNIPINYLIFQAQNTTNVVNPQGYISNLDINNLASLFRRSNYDDQHTLLTIIPNYYEIVDQKITETPLNYISDSITLDALLHYNSVLVYDDYRDVCAQLDIPIRRVIGDNLASSEANRLLRFSGLEEYFLLDVGASFTNLSFVHKHQLIFSTSFFVGGDHLTNLIASRFNLSFEIAQNLKEKFGYEKRDNYYDGVVYTQIIEDTPKYLAQSDLNLIMEDFFRDYFEQLEYNFDQLGEKLRNATNLKKVPLILVGGGSKLKGLTNLFEKHLPSHQVIKAKYEVLGARSQEFSVALGLLMVGSRHSELNDQKRNAITSFGRVQTTNKKNYNPTKDEL